MSRIEVPVLIVGAGPVGMFASILLAQQGIESLVVERRDGIHTAPQAHVLNSRTLENCRAAGFDIDAMRAQGTPASDGASVRWMTTLGGDEIGRLDFGKRLPEMLAASPTPILNLAQDQFEALLLEEVRRQPQVRLEFGWQWDSVETEPSNDQGVVSRVRELATDRVTEVQSRWLLAADGAGSRVRKSQSIALEGPERLQSFVMIHCEGSLRGIVGDRTSLLYFLSEPGAGGVIIAHHLDRTWVTMHPYDSDALDIDDFPEEVCDAIVRRSLGPGGEDLPFEIRDISLWTMTAQVAERYRAGRIFLVGDSAHRFPPTGGLGMNSGIQDVHNLVWKLAAVEAGRAPVELLESYEAERRNVAKANTDQSLRNALKMVEVVRALGINAEDDDDANRARMVAILADPAGRKRAVDAIAAQSEHFDMLALELGFSYETGAVVPDASEARRESNSVSDYVPTTRPGSRLPHAWLGRGDERVSTLDLVGYDRFTLLTGATGDAWAQAAVRIGESGGLPIDCFQVGRDLVDIDGTWKGLCEIEDDGAILVRPDQHVAWRVRRAPDDPARALAAAVETVLGGGASEL